MQNTTQNTLTQCMQQLKAVNYNKQSAAFTNFTNTVTQLARKISAVQLHNMRSKSNNAAVYSMLTSLLAACPELANVAIVCKNKFISNNLNNNNVLKLTNTVILEKFVASAHNANYSLMLYKTNYMLTTTLHETNSVSNALTLAQLCNIYKAALNSNTAVMLNSKLLHVTSKFITANLQQSTQLALYTLTK